LLHIATPDPECFCMSIVGAGLSPITLYLADSKTEAQNAAQYQAGNTTLSRQAAYFQSVAATLTTPEALLGNYQALSFVLGAFGVQDQVQNTGILKQLLTQDPTQSNSLAQTMGNPGLLRFALAMNQFNPPPFANSGDVTATVTAAATNDYEASQDTISPGLQNALYFTRNIGNVTTVDQLLSDPKLLNVVLVSSGIDPTAFGNLDFQRQQSDLTSLVTFSDFTDPAAVARQAETYLVRNSQKTAATDPAQAALSLLNGTANGSSASILGDVFGGGTTSSSSPDLLATLYPGSGTTSGATILSLFG
jgi:hypothetical protein